jgi:hypothetical protein
MFRFVTLAATASATKLLVVDNSNVVGGGINTTLVEVDLETQTERVINDQIRDQFDFVRGSIACGNTWYGIGSVLPNNLLAVVDLTTGDLKIWPVQGLWYDLKCGATEKDLLAVTATGSPPVFSLTKVTLEQSDISAYPQTETVGTFPDFLWGGWPSIFHFSENELQVTAPRKANILDTNIASGEVFRMDINTGEVTMHKKIKGTPGVPYYFKHAGGDVKTTGIFAKQEGSAETKLCEVDFSGAEIKVSNCKKDARWWAVGKPPVQCGSDTRYHWASVGAQQDKADMPIFSADLDTGDIEQTYFLAFGQDHYVGTHTCSPDTAAINV